MSSPRKRFNFMASIIKPELLCISSDDDTQLCEVRYPNIFTKMKRLIIFSYKIEQMKSIEIIKSPNTFTG